MLAIALALVAAALFALGTVLQQRVAMTVGDDVAHSAWFMLRLARSPTWLAGIGATLVGFLFHAAALGAGQLVVVQPILALTMVFALPLGAWLSAQRIGRRDVIAAVVVTFGLAGFLALSDPSEGRDDAPAAAWIVAIGGSLALSAALTAAGLHRRAALKAALVGTAAGVLFGLHGALVKAMVAVLDDGFVALFASWELYAVLIVAWISMTISQVSLQAGVLPPAIATQSILAPLVAIVLGVTLFQEKIHDSALGVALSVAALAVMFAGIVALSAREPAQARRTAPGSPSGAPRPAR